MNNIILSTKNEKIFKEKNIIEILGPRGSGKTITTFLIAKIISKNEKVLIIEDYGEEKKILKIENKKNEKEKTNNDNIDIINIKKIYKTIKDQNLDFIEEICKLKNKYNYIFIDITNFKYKQNLKKVINKEILILDLNILEIIKTKKIIIKNNNKNKIKIILNNYNKNSINEKIFKNIFNNKIEIIGKLKNNKNYNLIINNKINIKYLDTKTKKEIEKIIKKI